MAPEPPPPPERSPASGRPVATALLLGAASLLVFAALAPNALTNGDDAVYAQQIKSFDLSQRTTHLGYYLLATPLALLVPDFSDYALNLWNALFGALTITAICLWTRLLSGSPVAAAAAGLFLLTNYVFAAHSVFAEVYAGQTFFLVLAFLALDQGRPIAGGLAFGLSALITPSSLFAGPALIVLRPRLRPLVGFGAAAGLVLAFCLSWVLDDYLFGDRGLLQAAGGGLDFLAAVLKEGQEVVLGVSAWLPLLVLGSLELAVRPQLRRFGPALLVLWLVTFAFGEKYGDVPVQLPTYALLGVVVGLGVERLLRWMNPAVPGRRRLAGWMLLTAAALVPIGLMAAARPYSSTLQRLPAFLPAVLAAVLVAVALGAALWTPQKGSGRFLMPAALMLISATITVSLIRSQSREAVAYRDAVRAVGRVAEPDHLVLGAWTRGVLYGHYLHGEPYHESWLDVRQLDGWFGEADQAEAEQRWWTALDAGHEIWLLAENSYYLEELRRQHYRVEPLGTIFHARAGPPPAAER